VTKLKDKQTEHHRISNHSPKIWQSCCQMYTATFYESQQKCRF